MDVLAGKKLHYFSQYVLQKRECFIVARAVHSRVNPGPNIGRVRPTTATELRESRQGRAGMSWHFDLRHNGDVPRLSESHNFTDVFLRVVTAVTSICAVSGAGFWIKAEANILAPGTNF